MRSPCCLYICVSPPQQLSNFWTDLYETRYVYHGTWTHLNCVLHKSLPSVVRLYMYGKNVTAATNTHPTIQELLDATFSMRSVSYERRVWVWLPTFICSSIIFSTSLSVYPPIVARQRLGKHVPASTKNCRRRRFLCGPFHIKWK
jgi:hypothetical protein